MRIDTVKTIMISGTAPGIHEAPRVKGKVPIFVISHSGDTVYFPIDGITALSIESRVSEGVADGEHFTASIIYDVPKDKD